MFGKAKIENSNGWKSQNQKFPCLYKRKSRILMFEKAKIEFSKVLKSEKLWRIPTFGKREYRGFQCVEKRKSRILMFEKGKNRDF